MPGSNHSVPDVQWGLSHIARGDLLSPGPPAGELSPLHGGRCGDHGPAALPSPSTLEIRDSQFADMAFTEISSNA